MFLIIVVLVLGYIARRYFIKPFKEGYNKPNPKLSSKKSFDNTTRKNNSNKQHEENRVDDSVEKGRQFENFVVKRFESEHFYRLKEWRGDKFIDGIYAESNMYPDLEIEFQIKGVKRRFAIECKFRSSCLNDVVKFAEYRQLQNYKRFQKQNRIPVYILLGLGGEASNPKELFLMPVNELETNEIQYDSLKKFKKDLSRPFYFNLQENSLC